MDPISITAILAGLWTVMKAGASLSMDLHRLFSSIPAMGDIATRISELTTILTTLRKVLKKNTDLCNRHLLRIVDTTTKRVFSLHDELRKLMNTPTFIQKLLWAYKTPEIHHKLNVIEGHKSGIQLIQTTLILAALERKETETPKTKAKAKANPSNKKGKKNDEDSEIPLLRQQSEGLIYEVCNHITDLKNQQRPHIHGSYKRLQGHDSMEDGENNKLIQIREVDKTLDDTADWLYDLVFLSWAQSKSKNIGTSGNSSAVAIRFPEGWQAAIYKPGAPSIVVDTLLANWTTPDTIILDPGVQPIPAQKVLDNCDRPKGKKKFITFKVEKQEFTFPYHLIKTWEGMEQNIKQALERVDAPGPSVVKSQYNIVDSKGSAILPTHWEYFIEPGMHITLKTPSGPNNSGAKKPANLPPKTGNTAKTSKAATGNGLTVKSGEPSDQKGPAKKAKAGNDNKVEGNTAVPGQAKKAKQQG